MSDRVIITSIKLWIPTNLYASAISAVAVVCNALKSKPGMTNASPVSVTRRASLCRRGVVID